MRRVHKLTANRDRHHYPLLPWFDSQADAAPHHLCGDFDHSGAAPARAELTGFDAISPAGEAGYREPAGLIARAVRHVGEAHDRVGVDECHGDFPERAAVAV